MRQISRFQLCLLLTVASLLLALPAFGAAAPPLGKWEVAMAERGGKRMAFPAALVWTFEFFKGGKLTQRRGMKGKQIRADKERWVIQGEKMEFTSAKGKKDTVHFSVKGGVLTLTKPSKGTTLFLQRPGSGAVKVTKADRARTKAGIRDYASKSKAFEVRANLAKFKAGAKAYYEADHYSGKGNLLPKSFPAGRTGWTPAKACCKQAGSKCVVDAAIWKAAPWGKLHFGISDPHLYQYRYRARGKGKKASVMVEARGDLDCDGKFSSYKLSGRVVKGKVSFGAIKVKDALE